MAPAKSGGNTDPLERLAEVVDARIRAAFEDRDRSSREQNDPWAKLEGMIDRAVGKHFDEFARGLAEGGDDEHEEGAGRKPRVVKGGEGDDAGKLGILGL